MKVNSHNLARTDLASISSDAAGVEMQREGKHIDESGEISEDAPAAKSNAKSMLRAEGEIKRFAIEQDLDQPEMTAKEDKAEIKQQILEYPSGH